MTLPPSSRHVDAAPSHVFDPAHRRRTLAWALAGNLLLLGGVLLLRWPPGDVLVLFWIENVLLGVMTFIAILTARKPPLTRRPVFFVFHYGMFCLVHGVFIGVLAVMLMFATPGATTFNLAVPVTLLVLRYVGELVHDWVLRGGRDATTPEQAFWAPYPRVLVLHVATLLAWALMFLLVLPRVGEGPGLRDLAFVEALGPGTLMVAGLVVVKTLGDWLFATRPITLTLR